MPKGKKIAHATIDPYAINKDVPVDLAAVGDAGLTLDAVLEEMTSRHMGSVLVTSHGRLAGIFTSTDACRVLCDHLRALVPPRPGDNAA